MKKQTSKSSLTKVEARILLSIKKNITYISIGNLIVDWPDCDGKKKKEDWFEPLRNLTRGGHILPFEMEPLVAGKPIKLSQVHDLDFTRNLLFKLSPTGDRLLAKAKKIASGEPMPTLVHNMRDGTWKVVR
jgi:hypothetical protein